MLAPDKGQPVVLTGAMSSWPALHKWQDLDYLARVAGPRTVPIEMGKHYLADGWGQQLMLFSNFVKLHVQKEAEQAKVQPADSSKASAHSNIKTSSVPRNVEAAHEQMSNSSSLHGSHEHAQPQLCQDPAVPARHAQQAMQLDAQQQAESEDMQSAVACSPPAHFNHSSKCGTHKELPDASTAYLAQHPLFDQIPALRNDIQEPAYCALGEGQMQSINAWFGPANTVRSSIE